MDKVELLHFIVNNKEDLNSEEVYELIPNKQDIGGEIIRMTGYLGNGRYLLVATMDLPGEGEKIRCYDYRDEEERNYFKKIREEHRKNYHCGWVRLADIIANLKKGE